MTVTVQQVINAKTDSGILSVPPDSFVLDAIQLMAKKEVGALLVIQQGKLAGIVSERDYTRKVVLANRVSATTRVREIMTTEVISVTPDNTIDECLEVMTTHSIRHLPVITDGQPVTMLSVQDVMRSILREKDFIINRLEGYITDSM